MKIPHIPSQVKTGALIAGGVLGTYAALGFFVLPSLIKAKLPALVQQQTGRVASVAAVRFNPFSLLLRLREFELQEPDGRLFARFDEGFIDIDALHSIAQAGPAFDKVSLNKPAVRIAKHQDGTYNFKDLLRGQIGPEQNDGGIFPLSIDKLSITEGKLDWEDAHLKSPEQETVYPINLTIENFTTQADGQANFGLTLELNSGGKLDWQGAVSLKPLSSSGHIKLDNAQLPRIRALALQDLVHLNLQGYELFEADYKADYADNKFNINLNQGKFELRDVQASEVERDKTLIKMLKLAVNGIDFNLGSHELSIASVFANDADFTAGLNVEGGLNFPGSAPASPADASPTPPQTTPWNIKIDNIELINFGLDFEDRSLKKPTTLAAKPINFKLSHFSNQPGASLPFQFSASINKSGSIKLDGNAVVEPLSLQTAVEVKDIALENFQPYVDKFARLDVIDGMLTIDGKVLVAKPAEGGLDVKFTGNTQIADLLTRDQIKNKDFVKWENLALNGINIDLPANLYSAEALTLNKPYARVVIKKDKTVNFGDILIANKSVEKGKPGTAAKTAPAGAPKPKFNLGQIKIIDGSSDFSDLSLILPFAAQIKSLDGGASGISSEQKSTIKAELKGTAYDLSPVDVKGEISPYLGNYDVTVNFTGMPMPLISSYMVQFAGYKVEKGKMSLELNYKIADKELTASNNILIDQFELGEKVENPDAVPLPLELAVALMKDSDNKIKLHVPITGSLEDPQFSVRHIIVDALANSISKVVTSPFRALASLVGSEQDLSTISFPPGEAVLTKQQTGKLDDLAKALKTRDVLKLEIKGAAFQEQDWPAVSDDALYDQLKRIKAAEINKKGGRKTRAEYVVISDDDYRRLMELLFVEKFPLLVEKPLLGKTRLAGSQADSSTDKFYAVAKEKLSAIMQPEPQRLKDLAAQRAQAIAKYIVQKGGIANDRVYILDTVIDPKRENAEIVSILSLKVD